MTDRTHLNALELRLSHEREYLRAATSEGEKALRRVWIAQIKREIECEEHFILGVVPSRTVLTPALTDDELLAELMNTSVRSSASRYVK